METACTCWCQTPFEQRTGPGHDAVCNEMLRRQTEIDRLTAENERLKREQVDICPNCGRECDPTTCWCGDSHPKSYGDGGHSHIPMGCVCGYAVDVERDHFVLKQMLADARRDLKAAQQDTRNALAELELYRNPRT